MSDTEQSVTDQPIEAYRIEQIIFLAFFVPLTIAYMFQSLSLCWSASPRKEKRFTIRWTGLRIGPLSSLCITIRYIDAHDVYQIFSIHNRLSAFFYFNGAAFAALLAFSMMYSMLLTNSSIAQLDVPCFVPLGLGISSLAIIIAANLSPALSIATGVLKWDMLFFGVGTLCCVTCLLMIVFTAMPLRRKLIANVHNAQIVFKENPTQREIVEHSFRTFNRAFFWGMAVTFALGVLALLATLNSYQDDRVPDPQKFDINYVWTDLFLWIGLAVVLWTIWVPFSVAHGRETGCCCRLVFGSGSSHHKGAELHEVRSQKHSSGAQPGGKNSQHSSQKNHVEVASPSVHHGSMLASPTSTGASSGHMDIPLSPPTLGPTSSSSAEVDVETGITTTTTTTTSSSSSTEDDSKHYSSNNHKKRNSSDANNNTRPLLSDSDGSTSSSSPKPNSTSEKKRVLHMNVVLEEDTDDNDSVSSGSGSGSGSGQSSKTDQPNDRSARRGSAGGGGRGGDDNSPSSISSSVGNPHNQSQPSSASSSSAPDYDLLFNPSPSTEVRRQQAAISDSVSVVIDSS